MTGMKTDESLLDALRRATAKTPSAEELEKQRISFIMGTLKPDSSVTRAKVQEILNEHEGKKAS